MFTQAHRLRPRADAVALAGATPFPLYVTATGPRALPVAGATWLIVMPLQTGPANLQRLCDVAAAL